MSNYYRLVVATCTVAMLLSGCAQPANQNINNTRETTIQSEQEIAEKIETNNIKDIKTKTENNSADEDLIFIQIFSQLMRTNPSASDLASFMENHLCDSASDEAELALARVILAQNQVQSDWSNMLMDGRMIGYQNMGFNWDPDNIQLIEDPDTKAKYQELVDSYCRIMTYEETPVIETDWARMKGFAYHMSEPVSLMIDLNNKLQNYEYGAHPHDFDQMAADIISFEKLLSNRRSDFLSYEMNKTYNRLIGEMFYSVEGMNMEYWSKIEGPLLKTLVQTAESHPNTEFGKLCSSFIEGANNLKNPDERFVVLGNIIGVHNVFGLQSSLDLNMDIKSTDNLNRRIELIHSPHNVLVERKINNTVLNWFKSMRDLNQWNESSAARLHESSYTSFSSEKYYATTLFTSVDGQEDGYQFDQHHFIFDLKTGESVTLENLFGMKHEAYEPVLLDVIKDTYMSEFTYFNDLDSISEHASFAIDEYGISIQFAEKEISPHQPNAFTVYIPHGSLHELYDVIELYE